MTYFTPHGPCTQHKGLYLLSFKACVKSKGLKINVRLVTSYLPFHRSTVESPFVTQSLCAPARSRQTQPQPKAERSGRVLLYCRCLDLITGHAVLKWTSAMMM